MHRVAESEEEVSNVPEDQVRTDTMIAGYVQRYHTWPSNIQQNIDAHTWQVLRILFMVFGDPPIEVVKHVMFHDCGELKTGDAPYPIKRQNPDLKRVMDALEEESLRLQGIELPGVDETWALRIKTAHTIEMLEFGLHNMLSGNMYHAYVVKRMRALLDEQMKKHDPVEILQIASYVRARDERTTNIVHAYDQEMGKIG